MDLQQTWQKLSEEESRKSEEKKITFSGLFTKHPVQKLILALQVTLGFSIGFGLLFLVLVFIYQHWLLQIFLLLVFFAYVFFYFHNRKIHLQLKKEWDVAMTSNLFESLSRVHHIVSESIRLQEKAALFVYPISVTAGFLIGLYSATGSAEFDKELSNRIILISLGISILILTPASYFLSRWMYKVSFEVYLKQLKELINTLNQVD